MNEYNDDEKLDKYTKDRVEKGIKDLEEEKELKIKWRKEIDENEELQLYFSKYKPSSVDDYIKQYLNVKYNAYRYGDMYIKLAEEERSKWIDMAHEHLECILQKQLFDLQCLWRANEIKLLGIEKCFDFEKWGSDILNCPLLKPITKEEIQLYQDYLMKGTIDFANFNINEDWQNYDNIKEAYQSDDEESSIPNWYEHHYTYSGNTNLLLLPDSKGEKELFYRKLYFKSQQKANEEKKEIEIEERKKNNDPIPLVDNRPYLSSFDKNVTHYIFEKFEEKDMVTKYKYYSEGMEEGMDNSFHEDLFRELLEIKESVPVKDNYDIRDAIEEAYNNYIALKVAEHLPMAHEQYLFNRKMGFVVEGDKNYLQDADDIYTKSILEGRVLNGESRDFNY